MRCVRIDIRSIFLGAVKNCSLNMVQSSRIGFGGAGSRHVPGGSRNNTVYTVLLLCAGWLCIREKCRY